MSLSHSLKTNSSFGIDDSLTKLVLSLKEIKKEARQGVNFNQLEAEVHRLFNEAQTVALASILEEYDIDVPRFEYQGMTCKKAIRAPKRYMTAVGEVTVERSLYRNERNGKTYCPLEMRSGLVEGFWTPQAAKHAIHVVSLVTPAEAKRLFDELGGMAPSSSSLTRLPAKLNAMLEKQPQDFLDNLNRQLKVPTQATTVSVSLDGVMVAMRDQVLPGDSKWGEASCGTMSFSDAQGEVISTLYFARMPEYKKRSLKKQLASTMEVILQKRPDLSLVKVADGARDNWKFLEGQLGKGESVLDYYHASQHLHQSLECIYGASSAHVKKQHEKYRHILRDAPKGITKIIKHLEYKSKGKVKDVEGLTREIRYFKNNKHRCEYARLKAQNKPIGSGIVESACKTVVQIRCKRAGQRWDREGGQAILRFRSLLLSNQLDAAWDFIASRYRNPEIRLPDNVIPFPGI